MTPDRIFYCNAGDHMVTGDGFAVNTAGTYRTCYQCCAVVDRARMDAEGNARMVALSWHWAGDGDTRYVSNPPAYTLRMPVTRFDPHTHCIWFIGPGGKWYGRVKGSRVTHARRLKHK